MAAWDSVPNAGAGGADDRQKAWMNKKKLAVNVVSPPEEKKMCSGGLAGRGNSRCGHQDPGMAKIKAAPKK